MIGRAILLVIVMVFSSLAVPAADAPQTSRSTFVKLMDIQELWGEERYDEALTAAESLAEKTRGNGDDHAVALQYLAHTAFLAGRDELARPALEEAIGIPRLPAQFLAELKLFYGQVVLGDEEFELAARVLEEWYATTQAAPKPNEIFSLAYASFQTGNPQRAEELLRPLLAEATGVNDTWYRVFYQALVAQQKFEEAEDVLYRLVQRNLGDQTYWQLLANHYLQIEDSRQAAAALEIADLQGFLEDGADQRRLASIYGYLEAPDKGARILETAIASGKIERDADTLRRLGNLWLLARHRDKAIEYFGQAAERLPDGKTLELLGSLYFEDERWTEAHQAFERALAAEEISDPGRIHLLSGVSAMFAGNKAAARSALEQARQSGKQRAQAEAMLRRLDES